MSVAFSVRPAALAYPAKEYCEGEDQRSKASTNGSTDDGSVVLIASGWGGCCSRNCTCWSPDGRLLSPRNRRINRYWLPSQALVLSWLRRQKDYIMGQC